MNNFGKCIDFNTKDSLGWTLHMKACINGHNEVVKSLIFIDGLMIDFFRWITHCVNAQEAPSKEESKKLLSFSSFVACGPSFSFLLCN